MKQKNKITKNIIYILKLAWEYKKSFYGIIIATTILGIINSFSLVVFPGLILDKLSQKNYNNSIILAVALVSIIMITDIIIKRLNTNKTIMYQGLEISNNEKLAHSMLSIKYEKLESFKVREEYELAKKCIERNSVESILKAAAGLIASIITLIGVLYIASYMVWWIWLVIIVTIIIEVLCQIKRMNFEYDNWEAQNTQEMRMIFSREHLTSKRLSKEVRIFNMFDFVTNLAKKYINGLGTLQSEVATKTIKALWWSHLFNLIQTIVVYSYIAYKCFDGTFTIGEFTVMLSAMFLLSSTISNIAKSFLDIGNESRYIACFKDFINDNVVKKEKTFPIDKLKEVKLEFKNVSFTYAGSEKNAISNLSLTLTPNKLYGVVGENGAGKSTFVKLLMGLYKPISGEILLNNRNINDYDEKEYLTLFSTIFQDFNLFAYTLEENITMGKISDDNAINESLKKIGIYDKVNTLPNGIKTHHSQEYDEMGTELSLGEQQKIAITRTLYKDSPIFILDEPTSALSPKSEYELYEKFSEITKGKTVIYISHRLSSCKLCDEIFVFSDGNVVESGSHSKLMTKNGAYAQMFTVQASLYEEDNDE